MPRFTLLLFSWTLLLGGCPAATKLPPGPCGDAIHNEGEECDNGVLNSDVAPDACRSDCRRSHCGDGVIDSDEQCDSENLGGQTCQAYGFDGGQLICDIGDCTIITRHCTQCGDGLAEGGESCDGADLGGVTCADLGFTSGDLLCQASCAFDVTVCVGGCGNGVLETGEDCDGDDLGTSTCEDLGFASGTLGCAGCHYDRSGCVGGCGNGVVEPGEACDDGNDVGGDGCTDCRAGDGTFTAATPLPTASHPTDLRVVDVDGDGVLDLVVGYVGEAPDWGGVAVHLGLGAGSFAPAVLSPLSVRTSALAVAPLNGDSHADVALTFLGEPDDGEAPGGLLTVWGNGDGTFDGTTLYTPGTRPIAVEAGLLNGDGAPDLVVLNVGSGNVTALTNDGAGNLSITGTAYAFGWPTSMALGDFDGDGIPDLVVSRSLTATVGVFIGTGTGGFASAVSRYAGDRPAGVAAAPIDGNSSVDVLVALTGDSAVAMLAGDGFGELAYPTVTSLGGSPDQVLLERFDADPELDAAVVDSAADTVTILHGEGGGSYAALPSMTVGDAPSALRSADLNGDGIGDLVLTCTFSHDIHILWGNEHVP